MRSEVGFLVHESDNQASKQVGSRLKTPSLPIWVTLCLSHHGVLFNMNRELLRNYHAERRYLRAYLFDYLFIKFALATDFRSFVDFTITIIMIMHTLFQTDIT